MKICFLRRIQIFDLIFMRTKEVCKIFKFPVTTYDVAVTRYKNLKKFEWHLTDNQNSSSDFIADLKQLNMTRNRYV